MKQNKMLAMILAGGRGTRLLDLTKKNAKPAVYFGGKYRIIDFPLSNCANSNINVVGVLTQYESVILNSYAAAGQRWGLDTRDSGVYVLPPREKDGTAFDVYRGTADAISQNIDFIDTHDPEYVLVLSGDHIYKMDYRKMLKKHIDAGAAATIAVIDVPFEEASRFGIMNTDDDGTIVEFEEKPKKPKSTLASMGIYIFTYKTLRKYLVMDAVDPQSSNDFGKNIIPNMIADKEKLVAYRFDGYWKDVGTISSYWEANMDLLSLDNEVKLFDTSWKLYTDAEVRPSQYIGENTKIENSIITEGCIVEGEVINSILFPGCVVSKNSRVVNSIVMECTVIEENVIVNKGIILEGVIVKTSNIIGNGEDIAVIEAHTVVEPNYSGVN